MPAPNRAAFPLTTVDIFDNFFAVSAGTGLTWQVVKGTGGTLAVQAAGIGGVLDVPTAAAAANDYQLLATNGKFFKPAQNKPMAFEARYTVTEANTNNANYAMGFSSITTTGWMTNSNGGPPATWDGFCWYKTGGALGLGFRASVGSTNVDLPNLITTVSGTTYRLGFNVDLGDATYAVVTPTNNGVPIMNGAVPYSIRIAYASMGTMFVIAGMKCGSTSAETLSLDYIWASQER